MSKDENTLAILAKPFENTYDVDLKNQSYREAHKSLVRVFERNLQEETVRHGRKLSTQIKLALVGVLALAVTGTACVYMWTEVAKQADNNHTKVELRKLETDR